MLKLILPSVSALALVLSFSAQGALVTFNFDPNDLIERYPATSLASPDKSNSDSRAFADTANVPATAGVTYTTASFGYAPGASGQPASYNHYLNWRDSLGSGEGIASFNLFLRGDLANTASWGQTLTLAGDPAMNQNISGTAGGGWQVSDVTLVNPSFPEWGYTITFFTTDPNAYLRPGGSDLPDFSFTADLVVAGNTPVILGDLYRIWFGTSGDGLVFDNLNWGSRPSGKSPSSSNATTIWNGTVDATAVPEPSAITLTVLTLLAILPLYRRHQSSHRA